MVRFSANLTIVMQLIVKRVWQQIQDTVYNTSVVSVIDRKIVVRIIAVLITVLGAVVLLVKVVQGVTAMSINVMNQVVEMPNKMVRIIAQVTIVNIVKVTELVVADIVRTVNVLYQVVQIGVIWE
jgi:hypothetical protein